MRTLCIIVLCVLASACSAYGGGERALRCDSHLQPINVPRPPVGAPVQKMPALNSGRALVEKKP
ncbi:MAG: hypothetical protein JWM63_5779 [Gammaproteobacteria bacterium]|jgi:hypothetical protein|nr:hypothetical protein [Gammaproteobacteria bacterium]